MKTRKLMAGVVLMAGWLVAGCGGSELEPEDVSTGSTSGVGTRQDAATVMCTNKSWKIAFYSEPELINQVGFISCTCYQPQQRSGTTTNYQKLLSERTCSLE